MEEQLISFETAKLAKQKGFDAPYYALYTESGEIQYMSSENWQNWNQTEAEENCYPWCTAPTQSLLQKWLRETKFTVVLLEYNRSSTLFDYVVIRKDGTYNDVLSSPKSSYEAILEEGLKRALNLLPDVK